MSEKSDSDNKPEKLDLEPPKNGRPFRFLDPKDLAMQIQNYFDNCDPHIVKKQLESGYNDRGETIWNYRETMTEQVPYTVTDLARALKVSRTTLNNYRSSEHYPEDLDPEIRQELMDTIEDAIQRVEGFNERQLHKNGIANGVKFNLTNNFGWVDKQVVDNNVREIGDVLDDLDDPKAAGEDLAAAAKAELDKTVDKPVDKSETTEPEASDDKPGPETQE